VIGGKEGSPVWVRAFSASWNGFAWAHAELPRRIEPLT
jgi:hypothetical protein